MLQIAIFRLCLPQWFKAMQSTATLVKCLFRLMRQNKIHGFTLADQDWIGQMIFRTFADQDWIGYNW